MKIKSIVILICIAILTIVLSSCSSNDTTNLENDHVYINSVCAHCGIRADKWDGDTGYEFHSGSGTQEDPYVIETAEELAYLASCSRNISFSEKYIVLNNNIDLAGMEWEPIHSFAGTFDGQGYSIFSWKITKCDGSTGFFGSISGVVSNLKIENFIIDYAVSEGCGCSSNYDGGVIGGLVGNLNCGWIDSCAVSDGQITVTKNQGEINVGGIAGQLYTVGMDSAGIKNSWSNVSVYADQKGGGNYVNAGGIAGEIEHQDYSWYVPVIEACYSLSDVTVKCSSFWNCAGCYQYYGTNVGGIAGFVDGGDIILSYVLGKCETKGSSKSIGNIVGWQRGGSVQDCYVAEGHLLIEEGDKLSVLSAQDAKLIRQLSSGGITAILKTKWDQEKWYFNGSENPIQKCFLKDD